MSGRRWPGDPQEQALRHALDRDRRLVVLVHDRPSGSEQPAALARLVSAAGAARGLPVHRFAVEDRATAAEPLLLRLLLRTGTRPESLRAALLATPQRLAELTASTCREALGGPRSLVVLDDVPSGGPGDELLRAVSGALEGTGCVVLATSRTSHSAPGALNQAWDPPSQTSAPWAEALDEMRAGPDAEPLSVLAAWDGREFSPDLPLPLPVERWTRADLSRLFQRLHRSGLLEESRPGWYELAFEVREELRRLRGAEDLRRTARRLDSGLADDLTARTGELGDAAEPVVDLALRLLRSDAPRALDFLARLGGQLAAEAAILPLLMLKAELSHVSSAADALTPALAAAARQTGRPQAAERALTGLSSPAAVRELALTRHHMGLLAEAEATLDALPADGPDGWALHIRAAIRLDRGEVDTVGRLLRRAIEAHQVRGDRRGEAWAVFHYGRLRLLRGGLEEARKRLDTAWQLFRDTGDVVGAAWADTELHRVAVLMHGAQPRLLQELAAMPEAHRDHGDVRGEAWATLVAGLAYADAGRHPAVAALERAWFLFEMLPDRLGLAWAMHHRSLQRPAIAPFDRVAGTFTGSGSERGRAWAELREAVLTTRPTARGRLLGSAHQHFATVGDTAGEHWATVLDRERGPDERAESIRVLRSCYPPHFLAGVDWLGSRIDIPHAVRHFVPVPGTFTVDDFADDIPPTASRVRLTLLDDFPAVEESAAIMLIIEPGPEHPWAARGAARPLLTVRAVPLTRADVEPAHAVPIKRTATFHFTAHRAGRHRIRFTVEHQRSGTVLQQVETDIDVQGAAEETPFADPQPHALSASAPEPARRA
ncbi:hypothetical protein ACFYWX_06150 [Streptomyces sp. NPDC002888]|uniref:hypothetical protein n=1 Tax=Streptomyces sp. NPDC002888 TaxID=3364668 RepID=UPI003674CCE7